VRRDAVATTRRAESVLGLGNHLEGKIFTTEVAESTETEERKWRNNWPDRERKEPVSVGQTRKYLRVSPPLKHQQSITNQG